MRYLELNYKKIPMPALLRIRSKQFYHPVYDLHFLTVTRRLIDSSRRFSFIIIIIIIIIILQRNFSIMVKFERIIRIRIQASSSWDSFLSKVVLPLCRFFQVGEKKKKEKKKKNAEKGNATREIPPARSPPCENRFGPPKEELF